MEHQISLDGKVALVTGAGRGLGLSMANSLSKAGARVIAIDRDLESLQKLADQTDQLIVSEVGDVSSSKDMERIVASVKHRFGHIDVVISNAGIGIASIRKDYHNNPIRFWEVDPEVFTQFLKVNAVALLCLSNLVVPDMVEQGWGRIITVTTSLGTMIRPGMFPYGSSKAANEALASAMAGDLDGTGVSVNVLIPGGAADTAFVPNADGLDRSKLIDPLVMGPPAVWLASNLSDGFNGRRVIAKDWDQSMPPNQAAAKCSESIAWSQLIQPS